MSWLDKALLLAALAWCFLPYPVSEERGPLVLGGLLVLTAAALVAASWPARASAPAEGWFVRFGNLAWLPAVLLTVAAGLLLRPLHDLASGFGPGSTLGLAVNGTQLAVATLTFFLVAASVIHGSLFRWSRTGGDAPFARHPRGRTARTARAAGLALLGLGVYVLLLGLLITLKDHTAADYWHFGAVAAPVLGLSGAGLWFLTDRLAAAPRRPGAADGAA